MGKQSIFDFIDVDLVLSKGRFASWDGGVHLHQNFTEVTSIRSCCSPPAARVDGGSRSSTPCLPAEMPHSKTQPSLPWGRAQRTGALGRAGGGAPEAAKAAPGLPVTQPSALLKLGTRLSPWAGAQPGVRVKITVRGLRKRKVSPRARRELKRYCQSKARSAINVFSRAAPGLGLRCPRA